MKFCCAEKKLFFIGWLCMNGKSRLFRKTKTFSFAKNVSKCTQKPPFCTNLKLSFCTSPFLSPPKATLFHHKHRKFAPSHNLLSAKNTAFLLISALTPYAVTPEPRTDSKPFRHRLVRKAGVGSCCRKLYQNYFRQSFESRSQDGVPCAFYVTFCTMQKVTSRSPAQEASRFCEPRFSSPKPRPRTNKIKSF